MINKFKQISSNVIEYILEKETTIKPKDSITDRTYKLLKKFDFYKNRKDIINLDKTMEEVMHHVSISPELKISKNEVDYFVRDSMLVDSMKESLIFLAAKENKVLAYDLITKYKPVVKYTTILRTIDNNNLPALEMLLKNPDTKFINNREDVVDAKMIVDFACQQKKMDFLKFGSNLTDNSEIFYADLLRYTVKNNWEQGVKYVKDNFKDKISTKDVIELSQDCVLENRFDCAQLLKQLFPDSNISITNNIVEQKIKQIREKNAGQTNTKNVLKN